MAHPDGGILTTEGLNVAFTSCLKEFVEFTERVILEGMSAKDSTFTSMVFTSPGAMEVEFSEGMIKNFGGGTETWLVFCIKSHSRPSFIYFASVPKTIRY